jgi:Flp pilus assembly secretin CpaC
MTRKLLITSFLLATLGVAGAQQLTEMQTLMLGHVTIYNTGESFAQIIIGNPKIVDIYATSDRTVTMTALATGATNVIFVNARGEPVAQFEVLIQDPQQSRVRIHNKPSGLVGSTVYRCGPTFCDFIEENVTKSRRPSGQQRVGR